MKKIIHYYVYNPLVANLTLIFLFLTGLISLYSMKQEAFPRVNLRQVRILTVFPGASPIDVEKKITIPIEEKLREVEGLDSVRSISRNSESDINIKIDLEHPDPDQVVNDLRRAVDRVTNFPIEVRDRPVVTEQKSSNFPILEIAVSGNITEQELQQSVRFIDDELRKVPGVSRVDLFGKRKEEWRILVNPILRKKYVINFSDIYESINRRIVSIPGGSFLSPITKDIRVTGEVEKIDELKNITIRSNENGQSVQLSQVANLNETYERPRAFAQSNGKEAVTLQIIKKDSGDIIETVNAIHAKLEELKPQLVKGIEIIDLNDEGLRATKRLDVVLTNSMQGLILVVLVLIVFFSFRDAIISSLSLPLTLLGTIIAFPFFDISFNLVSMLGIIIALGMLVDNSIIISENIYKLKKSGINARDASVQGASELIVPIFGSYLTTVAAFLPLALMSGIMGRFIWQIPFMVIVALTFSLFESFLLLPGRYAMFGKNPKEKEAKNRVRRVFRDVLERSFDNLRNSFVRGIRVVVRRPITTLAVIYSILIGSVLVLGIMNFNLFPKEGIDYVLIRAEFPASYSAQETARKLAYFDEVIAKIPKNEIQSSILKIGIQQTDPTDPLTRVGENLGMAQIILVPETERKRTAQVIFGELDEELKQIPDATSVMVDLVVNGPPIGAAVTVAIEGRDYKVLEEISQEMKSMLRTMDGVINIGDDYNFGREEIQIRVKDANSALTGIDTSTVASYVRTAIEGVEAASLRKGKDEIKVMILNQDEFRSQTNDLDRIEIANRYGLLTPIGAVTTRNVYKGVEAYFHNDFEKAITVTADVNEEIITSGAVNEKILEYFSDIGKRYSGYAIKFRGEQESTDKSMVSLGKATLLALFAIYAILAIIFNSALKPLVILSCIPLGFVGVVIGFILSGKTLSFLAMVGIIGLAGVIVNASIVLVDTIQEYEKKGIPFNDCLIEAASDRFRPILVTTFTTMAGMIPTAYAIGGSDPILIPMTLSLAWGLGFGSFGSLVFIPAVFSLYGKVVGKK
ncbi:efflux RND transporter permease subunit [Leptospira sp. GIMC2001]|uniref:efflux RND transporter permease subunit n=1 Tax=Leptospira sp. GIMC2001 TaxID=1513297 RepID=UPI00234BAC4F|nr:efflux RND transporter permease subunit [Leptospira sp. GIMC2001]WCL48917.1 efflux RND transporter permease subunit [Leptospira sp. GIMC2001]